MFNEFRRIAQKLWEEGLVWSHGGDLSMRAGDKILITKKGAMLADLHELDILEVGMENGENDKAASLELVVHRAIYKSTPHNAIIHAHPPMAVALSITENKIVPQDAEGSAEFKAAPIIKTRDTIGSEEASRILPTYLNGGNVVAMIKGHGSIAVGADLESAYKVTSCLENSCNIIFNLRLLGVANNKPQVESRSPMRPHVRHPAIPPSLGVMDRQRERHRDFNRGKLK